MLFTLLLDRLGLNHSLAWFVSQFLSILIFDVVLLVLIAYLLLADRKIWAAVQMRRGPNVVGPFGLLQTFADLLKFLFKEIVIPAGANKVIFIIAPLKTNPVRGAHPVHSIVAMVKREVLRNGHKACCNWLRAGSGASVHRVKIGACHSRNLDLCSARFRQGAFAPAAMSRLSSVG